MRNIHAAVTKRDRSGREGCPLNRIKKGTNLLFNLIFSVCSLVCVLPFLFVFMISISSEQSIRKNGYHFIPAEFSPDAYRFLGNEAGTILHALGVSVFVTVLGTVIGLALTTGMGYVLAQYDYKLKKFFTWVVFIPMVFNGGMVANYVVNVNILHIKDTVWVLILPLAVSSFHVIICKTFFKTTIPDSIVESAMIDGASQFVIFSKIILPVSKPVLATIGLFLTFGYWNDWFQSSLYITNRSWISMQALLDGILKNIQYIATNPSAGVSLAQYKNAMPSETVRMAMAVVIVVPIACAYPFFQRYFITGLTIGAVKGYKTHFLNQEGYHEKKKFTEEYGIADCGGHGGSACGLWRGEGAGGDSEAGADGVNTGGRAERAGRRRNCESQVDSGRHGDAVEL